MGTYTLGMIAHVGAGKTALAEAMLAKAGAGAKTTDGGGVLDFLAEERERKTSLKAALAHFTWAGNGVDLVDTPGSLNFVGDTVGALRVIDAAVMVSSAEPGLQGQTEYFWDRLDESAMPRLMVINKMDRDQADFEGRLATLQETFGNKVVAISLPWGKASSFHGLIDLVEEAAYDYSDPAKPRKAEIPPDMQAAVQEYRYRLMEAVAEADDTLLEKYLETETLSAEELRTGLVRGTQAGKLVPVLCTAALRGIGVDRLLDSMVQLLPDVAMRRTARASETAPAGYAADTLEGPTAALIFKTQLDQYAGRMSLVRVMAGELKAGEDLVNPATGATERPAHLYKVIGRTQKEVPVLKLGELGALPKLNGSHTGQTLCAAKQKVEYAPVNFPLPVLTFALQLPAKGEEEKVANALHRMMEGDPTLQFRHNAETGDFLVSGMGKIHLDIVLDRLQREFNINASFGAPHIPYRETIRSGSKAQGKYKKQTGGRGQYGDCWLELKPNGHADDLAFHSAIVGGSIPKNYVPAVEKGVAEAMHKGVLAGYPVIGVDATVYDGSYHDVDSSEMAFKIAGSMAFKKAMESARPTLLEPVLELEIVIPGDYLGDVMGDINARRGRVLGMDNRGRKQVVRVEVPMAESLTYAIDLRALTSGQGYFTQKFARYDEVPGHLADKIVKERGLAKEE